MKNYGGVDFLQKAILRTLIYADIFDYPLNSEELYRFLIINHPISYSVFKNALSRIITNDKRINTNKNYYFLKGRREIISLRQKREKWSQEKIKIGRRIGRWLKLIPWIKLMGITGALAMRNSDKNDDIDLMIITSRNRLWLTRFLTIFLLEFFSKRRKPSDKDVEDKICLNLFIDEGYLETPREKRNLFMAHEVCQMKALWEEDDIYKKFLWENKWVKEFLPNAIPNYKLQITNYKLERPNLFFDFLEKIAFKIQLAYMKPKMTTEKVSEGVAFFHPKDLSGWVMGKYNERIKNYN